MDWLSRFIEFLLSIFSPKPPAPTPTTTTTPPPAPQPKRVTKNDDFRTLPTITLGRMKEVVAGYPFEQEAEAIHAATGGRPLPLAQSWMESRYGQDANALATRNPLGLLWYDGSPISSYKAIDVGGGVVIRLLNFPTWAAAFKEWARRMDDPTYKNGVYPPGMTLESFIRTYVAGPGPGYANGESAASVANYLNETVNRLNRYYGYADAPTADPSRLGQPFAVAGTTAKVILPFPLKQAIIPTSQTNQRPGIRMTPDRYVQHDTGNRNVGANAVMHKNYLHQGAPDNYGNSQQLSYHFTVDDHEAWQMIPVNEVSWHGGDGDGPCNMRGISCELCINADINEAKSRENAEILAAELMNALGLEVLWGHTDCCANVGNPPGCHSGCPTDMITDGYWPQFKRRVTALRASRR
mgnify:CR=1 FL=1